MTNVVCILGTPRSGTSVIARITNLLGVSLGDPQAMIPAGPNNPTGYWENRAFVRVNDRILGTFNGYWDRPPKLPPSWFEESRLDLIVDRAKYLIESMSDWSDVWGWKDPRNSLTVKFWDRLLPDTTRYVICVRNPMDAAKSLKAAYDIDIQHGLSLWYIYLQSALSATVSKFRHIVCYEDVMHRGVREIERLAEFVTGFGFIGPLVTEEIKAFLDINLWHYRSGNSE